MLVCGTRLPGASRVSTSLPLTSLPVPGRGVASELLGDQAGDGQGGLSMVSLSAGPLPVVTTWNRGAACRELRAAAQLPNPAADRITAGEPLCAQEW